MTDEIKKKNVDVIIKLHNEAQASDIAIHTDMHTFLQIVHCCQLARIFDLQSQICTNTSSTHVHLARQSSVEEFSFNEFPVYIVRDKKQEIKNLYRGKSSTAKYTFDKSPEVLMMVSTRYYLEIFWAMEPASLPALVQRQLEEELSKQKHAPDQHENFFQESLGMRSTIQSKASSGTSKSQLKQIPTFSFEQIRQFKQYISAHQSLQQQIEDNQYRIFVPYLVQGNILHKFREGDYVYLATKITRVFEPSELYTALESVHFYSEIFENKLVSIFPKKSQPKVLMREFLDNT